MTKLPDVDRAFVEEKKILDYLLNVGHEIGGPKARFFLRRGFSRAAWQELATALVAHARANEVAGVSTTRFGTLHEVACGLPMPDGTAPCILAVWEIREGSPPRLVTAYPNR